MPEDARCRPVLQIWALRLPSPKLEYDLRSIPISNLTDCVPSATGASHYQCILRRIGCDRKGDGLTQHRVNRTEEKVLEFLKLVSPKCADLRGGW